MKGLQLQYERCVRTRAREAECRVCVDVCPTDAVHLDGPRTSVTVDRSACVGCGICQASCPTEALSGAYSLEAFWAGAQARIGCGGDLPCVAALAVEDLITLALEKGGLRLEPKAGCAAEGKGHALLPARVEEANTCLEALGRSERVALGFAARGAPGEASPRPTLSRRRLLGLAPPAPPPITLGTLDTQQLRSAQRTQRRDRLLRALAEAEPPSDPIDQDQLSFVSAKQVVAERCTACTRCVVVCPTGALGAGPFFQRLTFETGLCVRCGLCHDVCETDAITLAPQVDLRELLATRKTLVELPMRPCVECGQLFRSRGDEAQCGRCQDLDDEARALTRWS